MAAPGSVPIDLVSDTATRPTPAMRQAMAAAEVGDEQRGEDPTVNALNARVAALLGQEAAMFLPSGTMCNQVAIATHCRPGDEIIAAQSAHIIGSEGAGAAVFAGCFVRALPCDRGIFSGAEVTRALRGPKVKSPRSRLVVVEQTSNRGGGSVWTPAEIASVAAATRAAGLALHMDGARLMNAAVASGVAAADFARDFDSVWLDLTKGLGCPLGGVLAGSRRFIAAAEAWKHRFGGALRQAGIVAAAGLHALDHHVERLAEDHETARRLAARLAEIPGIALEPPEVETNIVFFDVAATGLSARELAEGLEARGVRLGVESETRLRAVTHLDIDRAGIETAAGHIERMVESA